jgi:aminodeoxyfutalosine synthase
MTTSTLFDGYMERLAAGEALSSVEIQELATTPDILPLGMLADTVRRRRHGARTTFLRVAVLPLDAQFTDPVPSRAREIRLTGAPDSAAGAVSAISRARSAADGRTVSALSWSDIERLASGSSERAGEVLKALREAGLDSLAELPLDRVTDIDGAIANLAAAGFTRLRLTIDKIAAVDRTPLLIRAGELQKRHGCIQSINPLPMTLATFRPTTGYDDVKMVAIARLAAPEVPSIQVDWLRYGPKLAQVALTFGVDDIDGISPSDEAPEGRRRAPLEEIRRNIDAAGYTPVERDGRYEIVP